ncbi:acyl carrier protein, partial [Streptomyces sp. AF1A]|uniref:acyl carrier protein n=1 Tax=Streptomyces sp. AF1A TaxID=3394350 RepID=UPI0039BD22D6
MRDVTEDSGQRATAEAIERGGGGLGVDDLLARVMRAAGGADLGAAPAPPARDVDGVAAAIAAAAGRYLPAGHLAPDADFFDAGGTSVHAVELVAELEGELGIEFDLDEVFADARPISLARRWLEATGAAAPSEAAAPARHAGTRAVVGTAPGTLPDPGAESGALPTAGPPAPPAGDAVPSPASATLPPSTAA